MSDYTPTKQQKNFPLCINATEFKNFQRIKILYSRTSKQLFFSILVGIGGWGNRDIAGIIFSYTPDPIISERFENLNSHINFRNKLNIMVWEFKYPLFIEGVPHPPPKVLNSKAWVVRFIPREQYKANLVSGLRFGNLVCTDELQTYYFDTTAIEGVFGRCIDFCKFVKVRSDRTQDEERKFLKYLCFDNGIRYQLKYLL